MSAKSASVTSSARLIPAVRAGLVYYKRPNRSLMQFYSSDSRELDILPSQTAASSAIRRPLPASLGLTLDFTRPSMASSANWILPPSATSDVFLQVNASHTVATFVEQALSKPRSTHTSKSTPAESEELSSMQGARQTKFTVEQLDVRSEQVSFIVTQAPFIFGRVKARSTDSISRYVKFYNCIWLTLNDIIIGVAFGSFLCENCHVLGSMLDAFTQLYLVGWMQRALIWLNSWPAGLKLNTELSQFYCHSLLIAITIWGRVLRSMGPYYPALLWVVGAMGCCGMTMIVSLLSDIIGVLTSHLYVCYVLSATAFRHQLGLAGSLWNLFRGMCPAG
ncbi:N-acetylglucosaminyl transferase component-domain-containing protein [Fomitopsis serialis]|uniref:N-acetylglucosaminyl transferase component-domain-containing protein n=1 Tax=Fomitopsis serialis TaxID=139415 RepID=UPI002008B840|nr:N-acetylglucosaminyl transferase component-domain-containing protein [Neoantrodia serialis]KAH9925134.1 N-acetylglucosaminyl transferase component-domain-containing protein [Neoantrodia serialis]